MKKSIKFCLSLTGSGLLHLKSIISKKCPSDIASRAARKLEYVDLAVELDDLKVPPGNRLHALSGDRKGQYAISVNDQWRGDAYDVEICDNH